MRRKLSLTARLTIFFSMISALVLLGLVKVITLTIENYFLLQDDRILKGKSELVRESIRNKAIDGKTLKTEQLLDAGLVGHQNLSVVIVSQTGRVIYTTEHSIIPSFDLISRVQNNPSKIVSWRDDGREYRILAEEVLISLDSGPPAPSMVLIALDNGQHQAFMLRFQQQVMTYTVVAVLISGLLGWIATRKGLTPLLSMKNRARRVTAEQLNHRMEVESVPVEIAGLADVINTMLERLEQAFSRLSQYSSDIAHELRTPISNLMTQSQVALTRPRGEEDYRAILYSNIEEYERLSRMISDMLFLAKAEHMQCLPSRSELLLENEITDLIEFYEALAEEQKIKVSLSGKGKISGDQLMIRRAISNLLSNAIRHTPKHEAIHISLSQRNDKVMLDIRNSGETISVQDLPYLFDRFYRSKNPSKNNGSEDGFGLGLAITKAIIEGHNGRITVRSDSQETCFHIEFKVASN
ncbi:MAG: heavy metal sensor histidine kinase [Motiliproteus sp.]|nr:heavy metal sensor histidine kinase [Motiliproteus sp.]MCW9052808.1 heavy metal sensor histidine kinase [Motiliproteus sp.]